MNAQKNELKHKIFVYYDDDDDDKIREENENTLFCREFYMCIIIHLLNR